MIRSDGIDVIATGLPSGSRTRRTIAVTALRRTLLGLPITAWPYGRIVAVQEIGLGPVDGSDLKPIADNLATTLTILKYLNVTANRWPN